MWSHLSRKPDAMAHNRILGLTTVFAANTRRTFRTRPAGHDLRVPTPQGLSVCSTPMSLNVRDR